jgi:hypothetical protein
LSFAIFDQNCGQNRAPIRVAVQQLVASRLCIKILILVWQGSTDRNTVNALLDEAALDEIVREDLLKQTDIEAWILEITNPLPI